MLLRNALPVWTLNPRSVFLLWGRCVRHGFNPPESPQGAVGTLEVGVEEREGGSQSRGWREREAAPARWVSSPGREREERLLKCRLQVGDTVLSP